jgi:hypothetical protein
MALAPKNFKISKLKTYLSGQVLKKSKQIQYGDLTKTLGIIKKKLACQP